MIPLQLVAGLLYLLLGGDLLVRGAVALSQRWGLSPMLVGVTIVAIGTSAPELIVSVQSALVGHEALAVGNVVGSNIANAWLVLGALAIASPVHGEGGSGDRGDTWVMLSAIGLFVAFAWDGHVSRLEAVLIAAGAPLFIWLKIRQARQGRLERAAKRDGRIEWVLGHPSRPSMIALFLIVGAGCLPLGATLLIEAAAEIAAGLGVSEGVIGATLVAVGTSLPELATSLVAAARRQAEVAVGNAVGSNVFNIVLVLGAAGLLAPNGLPIPRGEWGLDLAVLAISALTMGYFALFGRPVRRPAGIAALILYASYVTGLYALS